MVTGTPPARRREPLAVELYVRSLSPHGFRATQERVLNRLERLAAVGTITDYTVEVWGDRLAEPDIRRTDTATRIFELIETFRDWADTSDRSIAPFFETDHVNSTITGESYDQIVFPSMTLAEYEGDTLRFVVPCTDGETAYTVDDRLDALEEKSPLKRPSDRDRYQAKEQR